MSRLLDTDADPRDSRSPGDHEISLGVPTILAIFFGLALVCAAFFGFGYTAGRKSAQNAVSPSTASLTDPPIALKPAAGSLVGQSATAPPVSTDPGPTDTPTSATPPPPAVTVSLPPLKTGPTAADGMIVGDKPPATGSLQPATSFTGAYMVQVAAVSSQEIADIELAALKKYGYNVVVRHEPKDQLLHIQIGPFATRKDADAMRADVQAHGFNAIVK